MPEASGNILREMFVKIGLLGAKSAKKGLKGLQKGLKALVGDIKVFQANLSALAVSSAFGLLNRGISSAIRGFKELIVESSTLAAAQKDNEGRLITAMKIAGDFSQLEFEGMTKFASAMQDASEFGDELIISQLALVKSFGASNAMARDFVQAAADMASAQGKPLQETTRQLAKTLGGFGGELSELSPEIKALTAEELKAGKAAKILMKQFGGSAAKNVTSFAGRMKQLLNVIGDAKEAIGIPINEVLLPALQRMKASIQEMTPVFARFGTKIAETFKVVERIFQNLGGQDFLAGLIDDFGLFILDFALLVEDFIAFISGKDSFIGSLIDGEGGFGGAISEMLAGITTSLAEGLVDVIVKATPMLLSAMGSAVMSLGGTFGAALGKSLAPSTIISGLTFGLTDNLFGNAQKGIEPGGDTDNSNKSTVVNINMENKIQTNQTGSTVVNQLNQAYSFFEPVIGVL